MSAISEAAKQSTVAAALPDEDDDVWEPVLQIFHVTDLHVKDTTSANPITPLLKNGRLASRLFMKWLERRGDQGWDEGTQGHYPMAPESFRRFILRFLRRDERWSECPAWLVDTGDRTAFGDQASLDASERHLNDWRSAIGNAPVRTIYGNHDAWPLTFPLANGPEAFGQQKGLVRSRPGWQPGEWIANPLSIELPGGHGAIELFALDSVCWGKVKNTLALGELESEAVASFVEQIRERTSAGRRGLRILAMHHPLAFPWDNSESRAYGLAPQMRLLNDEAHARRLRNDNDDPKGAGSLAHLFLSGHTHASHPAPGALEGDVVDIFQGLLGRDQLQLVGGPLMLNRSRTHDQPRDAKPAPTERDAELFKPASVLNYNCQAQILRFLASETRPGILQLVRIPVFSVDGSHYEVGDPDGVTLQYSTP